MAKFRGSLTQEQADEIVRRYKAGQSGPSIYQAMNLTKGVVYSALYRGGVRPRKGGAPKTVVLRNARVLDMHRNGFRQAEIARSLGISRQRVNQIITREEKTST